jgi:wyosine [tRNA(Phe)-imidazoG37] synthetase (radical SAM superfamily)
MSLGIDMVPFKTCPLNCIYCECGATTNHTLFRKEYVPAREIIKELDDLLSQNPSLDSITFAGSGEPTLSTALPEILDHCKTRYPSCRTALLTNSALLHDTSVRTSLMAFDVVLPSLDAVSEEVFQKINNPVPGLTSAMIIDELTLFAQDYDGTLWIEIFVVPGVNDTQAELEKIKMTLDVIQPDRVQLNTLDRPGTCDWVVPASFVRLQDIARFLLPLPVEIISRSPAQSSFPDNATENSDTLLNILKRRPMTIEDCAVSLGKNINEIETLISMLASSGTVQKEIVAGKEFYRYRPV